jgi:hypothetical protein
MDSARKGDVLKQIYFNEWKMKMQYFNLSAASSTDEQLPEDGQVRPKYAVV